MNRQNLCPPELLSMDNAMEDFMAEHRAKNARVEFVQSLSQNSGFSESQVDQILEERMNANRPNKNARWIGYLLLSFCFALAAIVYGLMVLEATR